MDSVERLEFLLLLKVDMLAARVQREAVGFLSLLCRPLPIPLCHAAPEPPVFIFLTPSHHLEKKEK